MISTNRVYDKCRKIGDPKRTPTGPVVFWLHNVSRRKCATPGTKGVKYGNAARTGSRARARRRRRFIVNSCLLRNRLTSQSRFRHCAVACAGRGGVSAAVAGRGVPLTIPIGSMSGAASDVVSKMETQQRRTRD